MFTGFFYLLRAHGFRVSLNEWMTLIEGLMLDLQHDSLTGFYELCRAVLVKSEADYDKFDQIFLEYFDGVPYQDELPKELMDWLNNPAAAMEEFRKFLRTQGYEEKSIEEILKMFEERLKEQTEEHNGGNYWVGTQGRTPWGNSGWHPGGIRIGGQGRHRTAMTVAGERKYRDFRKDNTLDTRQFQMAFRSLRQLSSNSDEPKTELDIDTTIRKTCDNAGNLSIEFTRPLIQEIYDNTQLDGLVIVDTYGSSTPDAVEEMFRRSRDMQERASGAASRLREEQNEFQLRSGFREERIRRLAETAAEHEKKETELLALRQERAAMLNGLPADRAERQHETAVAAARRAFEEAEAGLQRKRELHTVLRTRFEETTRRLTAAEAELAALPADSRLPEEKSAEAAGLREKARRLDEEAGALGQKLESDREARGRRQAEEAKIGAFRSEVERWRLLNELIGKQDGGKFQQFAQSLIFEQLIALANRSLRKFTDRYRLVSIEDSPLDFNVIDHYQCDEIRSVRNLSGGESFLVSMSLALALSQTAGEKLRIDTLFLDEGFGTLDEMFELLTLVQTHKVANIPVVLYGKEYWQGLFDWLNGPVAEHGMISTIDPKLVTVTDDADEAVDVAVSAIVR